MWKYFRMQIKASQSHSQLFIYIHTWKIFFLLKLCATKVSEISCIFFIKNFNLIFILRWSHGWKFVSIIFLHLIVLIIKNDHKKISFSHINLNFLLSPFLYVWQNAILSVGSAKNAARVLLRKTRKKSIDFLQLCCSYCSWVAKEMHWYNVAAFSDYKHRIP